jgi:hypothetical protein
MKINLQLPARQSSPLQVAAGHEDASRAQHLPSLSRIVDVHGEGRTLSGCKTRFGPASAIRAWLSSHCPVRRWRVRAMAGAAGGLPVQLAAWAQRLLRVEVFDSSWAWVALACLLAGAVRRCARRRMCRAIYAASTTASAISR